MRRLKKIKMFVTSRVSLSMLCVKAEKCQTMHEGLKNGKNDYKWRFVLNRCPFQKEMYKSVHLMYNVGDISVHSQFSVISAVLFPIIDLRCRLWALNWTRSISSEIIQRSLVLS